MFVNLNVNVEPPPTTFKPCLRLNYGETSVAQKFSKYHYILNLEFVYHLLQLSETGPCYVV